VEATSNYSWGRGVRNVSYDGTAGMFLSLFFCRGRSSS
jgi:hypothetical protein